MDDKDKELIQWHMHQAAVNHKLAETAASTASHAHSCECEKMHRDTAARLRELAAVEQKLTTATALLGECEKALSACAEYGKPCACGNCDLAGKVRTHLKGTP